MKNVVLYVNVKPLITEGSDLRSQLLLLINIGISLYSLKNKVEGCRKFLVMCLSKLQTNLQADITSFCPTYTVDKSHSESDRQVEEKIEVTIQNDFCLTSLFLP